MGEVLQQEQAVVQKLHKAMHFSKNNHKNQFKMRTSSNWAEIHTQNHLYKPLKMFESHQM